MAFDKEIPEPLGTAEVTVLTFCTSVESTDIPAQNPEKVRRVEFQGVLLPVVHEALDHSAGLA